MRRSGKALRPLTSQATLDPVLRLRRFDRSLHNRAGHRCRVVGQPLKRRRVLERRRPVCPLRGPSPLSGRRPPPSRPACPPEDDDRHGRSAVCMTRPSWIPAPPVRTPRAIRRGLPRITRPGGLAKRLGRLGPASSPQRLLETASDCFRGTTDRHLQRTVHRERKGSPVPAHLRRSVRTQPSAPWPVRSARVTK